MALALALGQLALGLALGRFHELGGYVTEADFYGMYAPGAQALARGEPYAHTRSGPGYAALLAIVRPIAGDLFVAAKWIAAAGVAAAGYGAFLLALSITSARASLLLQVVVYAVLLRFSFTAANDVPCAALATLALALSVGRERPSVRTSLAAGALAGLAFLTRYTAAAAIAVGLVWLAFLPAQGAALRERAAGAAAFAAGAALACLPWMWASYRWFGTPLHNKAYALVALDAFGGERQKLDMGALSTMEQRFTSLADVLLHDPPRLAAHLALDFYRDANQLLEDLVTLPAYLFLGLGAVLLLREPAPRRWRFLALQAFLALGFASAALAPYQSRYHFSILPALLLPVAVALAEDWPFPARAACLARRTALVLSLTVVAGVSALKTREYLTTEPTELLEAQRSLVALARPGERIVARKPHLAFLAGLEMEPLRGGDLAGFLRWLREESGARFLYVGPQEVASNPALAPLARGQRAVPGLRTLHTSEGPPARLYEIE